MSAVGIAGIGSFVPPQVVTAEDLSVETGIPATVLREKFGVRRVYRAGPEEHVSTMAAAACERALADAGLAPEEVDLLVYCGSEYKDYIVWSAASRIADLLGCRRAQAFEVYALCAGMPLALRVVKHMLLAEPALRTALVVAASKESALVDRRNQRTRFMFDFGDGAAAVALRRDLVRNRILASASVVDGTLSEAAIIPAGGSRRPASAETVAAHAHYLDVPDLERMRIRLDAVSSANFQRVVREALQASERDRIDLLVPVHLKRSLHDTLVGDLGAARGIYLEDYGHMQAADQIVGLYEARRRGMLHDGDVVALLAAGVGYTWAATIIAWGED